MLGLCVMARPGAHFIPRLLLIGAGFAVALGLFLSGFFLTRHELGRKSSCAEPPPAPGASQLLRGLAGSPRQGCWLPRAYSKLVVVIVDALRCDFVLSPNATDVEGGRRHYLEQMPYAAHLAATGDGGRARYYCAEVRTRCLGLGATSMDHSSCAPCSQADAPTVTLQRLKGITTGGLPTFIDIGSNFGGHAIREDSWLGAASALGRRFVHGAAARRSPSHRLRRTTGWCSWVTTHGRPSSQRSSTARTRTRRST